MASTNSPSLIQLFSIVFVISSCCLEVNFVVAHRTSTHRIVSLNSKDKHLASELFKRVYLNSLGQSIKLRKHLLESAQAALYGNTVNEKPSKRFHHYLTITRNIYPSRRSYIKPIRNKEVKNSDLVPVIDHFAGIKTWTVPYGIRDVLSSTTETILNERKDITTEILNSHLKPTLHTELDRPILTKSAKEELFDHEYTVNGDIARFVPNLESNDVNFVDDRYSEGIWNDYPKNVPSIAPSVDSNNDNFVEERYTEGNWNDYSKNVQGRIHINSHPAYGTSSKDTSPGRRRDYSSFGKFKALGPGDFFGGGSDLFSFPESDSFGKFVPDKSKSSDPFSMFTSEEADWGRAKNRELHQGNGSDTTDAVKSNAVDNNFKPPGGFQSIGVFRNDKNDCENIESKTCRTNDDCSCYGFYKCSDGLCTRKSSHTTTTTDSSRDVKPTEFWHSGPYSDHELGIND